MQRGAAPLPPTPRPCPAYLPQKWRDYATFDAPRAIGAPPPPLVSPVSSRAHASPIQVPPAPQTQTPTDCIQAKRGALNQAHLRRQRALLQGH